LKSFTGTVWDMPSWKAPAKGEGWKGDVKSDSSSGGEAGADKRGRNEESSWVGGSERCGSRGGEQSMMVGIESSPVRGVVA
jgi:hypothetical protein